MMIVEQVGTLGWSVPLPAWKGATGGGVERRRKGNGEENDENCEVIPKRHEDFPSICGGRLDGFRRRQAMAWMVITRIGRGKRRLLRRCFFVYEAF